MVTGLVLAETTPGPLIMGVQFVAFVGAYRDAGDLNPWVARVLASLLVTWVTSVPYFFVGFVGAPTSSASAAITPSLPPLTGIMAAVVVGVIANLAIFFAAHTLFRQVNLVEWDPSTFLLLGVDGPLQTTRGPCGGA